MESKKLLNLVQSTDFDKEILNAQQSLSRAVRAAQDPVREFTGLRAAGDGLKCRTRPTPPAWSRPFASVGRERRGERYWRGPRRSGRRHARRPNRPGVLQQRLICPVMRAA